MADIENVVDMKPGNLPALKRGEKVGKELQMYGAMILPETFGQVVEYAQMMAKGGLAIPKHMREQPGVCMAVIQRSLAWQMDPWAVATKTYAVNDILAYEAQLIAAVVKKWAPVKERVWNAVYEGEGLSRKCRITVHHNETGEEITYESPIIGPFDPDLKVPGKNWVGIFPKNSPLWKTDPDQQLYYYSIRAFARRYFPEILLGVYDREEAYAMRAMRDVTPDRRENKLFDEPEARDILDGEVEVSETETVDPDTGEITLDKMIEDNQVPLKEPVGEAWTGPGKRLTVEELEKEPEAEHDNSPLTEEQIVANIINSIGHMPSLATLADYKRNIMSDGDIKKFSAANRKALRNAFFEKEGAFEEL